MTVNPNVVSKETKTDQAMGSTACRDCGYLLENTARGCPRCAMNLEAETMIERFVWRRLVPGVIVIIALAVIAVIYLVR